MSSELQLNRDDTLSCFEYGRREVGDRVSLADEIQDMILGFCLSAVYLEQGS